MTTLTESAIDLLFEADHYSIAGLELTDDNQAAAAELIAAELAEQGIDPDDDIDVIRLTDLGVAELAFHVEDL